MRCPEPCGKIMFSEGWKAMLDAIRLAMTDGVVMTPYHSRDCGCYHLTGGRTSGKPRTGKKARKIRMYASENRQHT